MKKFISVRAVLSHLLCSLVPRLSLSAHKLYARDL